MKRNLLMIVTSLSLLTSSALLAKTFDNTNYKNLKNYKKGKQRNITITQAEKSSLIYLREEEKLARDVYDYLYSLWGAEIFSNIYASEVQHMAAVKSLLDKYNIKDPIADDIPGIFANEELQHHYDVLTSKGSISLTDALEVGATIEDLDIYDLDEDLHSVVINSDIEQVYNNLLKGSINHINAFVRQLGSYTPQYISQERYNEVIR